VFERVVEWVLAPLEARDGLAAALVGDADVLLGGANSVLAALGGRAGTVRLVPPLASRTTSSKEVSSARRPATAWRRRGSRARRVSTTSSTSKRTASERLRP
jgi:hypothetical protein